MVFSTYMMRWTISTLLELNNAHKSESVLSVLQIVFLTKPSFETFSFISGKKMEFFCGYELRQQR
jgi:hypothetical protein